MGQDNREFVLTKKHLREGISKKYLRVYAGIQDIVFIDHDEVRHSAQMRRRIPLLPHQQQERAADIAKILEKADFPKPNRSADVLSRQKGAACLSLNRPIDLSSLDVTANEGWNPYSIQTRYKFLEKNTDGKEQKRWVVVPKPLDCSVSSYITQPSLAKKAAILHPPAKEDVQDYWAFHIYLPARCLTRLPDMNIHKIGAVVHEIKHPTQITNGNPDSLQETDCDMFMRDVFGKQLPKLGIDPEPHLEVNIFCRYAQLFCRPDREHQIAPAIDAIEAGEPMPSQRDIETALDHIRDKIAKAMQEPGCRDRENFAWYCASDPHSIYGLLRFSADRGYFEDNLLAKKTANRILEAVEFFSKGISQRPSIVNPIYQVALAAN